MKFAPLLSVIRRSYLKRPLGVRRHCPPTNGVFATFSVPSPIVGGGSLTIKGNVTLSGANTYTGNTSVGNSSNATTLTISSPANLGDPANTIVFNQGTLRTTTSMNLGRNIILNTGVGTFDTSVNAVAAGTVEGVGAFTKTGAGILAVTHLRLTPAPLSRRRKARTSSAT